MNIKNLFPIFKNRPEITYLDSAATSQKPQQVIDAMSEYYSMNNANIKRGIYSLAENTTTAYEDVRVKVASFVNVQPEEIVFTSSATEGVNFIAQAWGSKNISAGDEILVTELEHHSNFLPWQRLVQEKGAILKIAPIKFDGKLDYEAFSNLVTPKTKLIALTAQSNVTGEIVDLKRVVKLAKQIGAKLFVDAAQAIAHKKFLDQQELVFYLLKKKFRTKYSHIKLVVEWFLKLVLQTLNGYNRHTNLKLVRHQ